jgi:OmpA family
MHCPRFSKQSPAVSFEFGAKLSGGIGGAAVGVQTLAGVAWLLDGGESRIVVEPKATKEVESFESYWQDHVPSLAVHFPINGARLPVPTEAEQARMREQGSISVKEALDAFAACELPLIANPAARIVIDGYADAPGDVDYNNRLSFNRAESVRNYLASILGEHLTTGLDYDALTRLGRILIHGHGEPPGPKENGPEKFNPSERRTDIAIWLTTGDSDDTDDTDPDPSLSWQLRRSKSP